MIRKIRDLGLITLGVGAVTWITVTPLDLQAQIIFGAGIFAVVLILNRVAGAHAVNPVIALPRQRNPQQHPRR